MVGYVLRENDAMRKLAQSQGFVVDAASDADAPFLALTLPDRSDAMECNAGGFC